MRTITLTDDETYALLILVQSMFDQQDALAAAHEKLMRAFEAKTGLEPEQILAMSRECHDHSALSEAYIAWLEAHENASGHTDIACEFIPIIRKLEAAPRWGHAPNEPDTFARRMAYRQFRREWLRKHKP